MAFGNDRIHTSHEIRKVAKSLTEYHIPMFRNTLLQLFLQIATPMLILTELGDFPLQLLQPGAGETIN
jgi:hypothetical protein